MNSPIMKNAAGDSSMNPTISDGQSLLALMHEACRECDTVVASVFVGTNPVGVAITVDGGRQLT